MFLLQLIAISLAFAQGVAAGPLETVSGSPEYSGLNTTTPIKKKPPQTLSPITSYGFGFTPYEKRIRVFIENTRREYCMMDIDPKFLNELDAYMDQLPVNSTKVELKKFRSTCYCEGQTWTPCPERCMDSCYRGNYGQHFDNCTGQSSSDCYCYSGSSTRCNGGDIQNCYEEKLELTVDPHPCVNFTIDRSLVIESYSRFAGLLVEPLKILVRGLEFKLASIKQSAIATDLLTNVIAVTCDENEPTCLPEAADLLSQKQTYLRQLRKNITLDMIKTQSKAESVAKDVDELKEQTLNQLNQSIKDYACCLKGLKFSVKDNDCSPKSSETATTTVKTTQWKKPCPHPNFQCTNHRCILEDYRCDGADDCGDNSDEENC